MDNRYYNYSCPPLMNDGRFISSYVRSSTFDQYVRNVNNIENGTSYRHYLQNNGDIYIYDNYIYAKKYYEAETKISKFLVKSSQSPPILSGFYLDANQYINDDIYSEEKVKRANCIDYNDHILNEQQKNACMQIFKNNFCVITGKAGTGKSSGIMIPLLFFDVYLHNIDIICLSPTGKACTRLDNEFGKNEYHFKHKAHTIHKFIYYNTKTKLDENKNIDVFNSILNKNSKKIKLIIIDEFSMVDLLTFYEFIKK